MSNTPGDNRVAFRAMAKHLRDIGWIVISPDELDDRYPLSNPVWVEFLTRDLPFLVQADCGVALTGWRMSKGATLQAAILAQLGRPVFESKNGGWDLVQIREDHLPQIVHPVT